MQSIKIFKTRNVITPNRGTPLSAGIDLYIPNELNFQELSNIQPVKGCVDIQYEAPRGIITQFVLSPQQRVLIPSGIKVKFPKGYCGLLVDKSGVSSKSGLTLLAKLIDEDYQGEIHINVVNTSNVPVKFFPGQKLTQMIVIPVSYCEVETVNTIDDLYNGEETVRGEGGFGSTGISDYMQNLDSAINKLDDSGEKQIGPELTSAPEDTAFKKHVMKFVKIEKPLAEKIEVETPKEISTKKGRGRPKKTK